MNATTIKPKFYAVKMDETEYWSVDIQKKVKQIFSVYIFNANEVTYCCSSTPSYCLHFVGVAVYANHEDEYGTDEWSETVEAIEEASFGNEAVSYFNCNVIDSMLKNTPENFDGDFNVDDDWEDTDRDELMNDMIEAYSGNPTW